MKTDYQNNYDYLSKSFLTKFEMSPLHAHEYMIGETKETEAMRFGRCYHAVIANLTDEYIIFNEMDRPEPDKTFGSKLNKEWKINLIESANEADKDVLSVEEYNDIQNMIESLKSNEIVQKIHAFDLMQEEAFMSEVDKYKIKCKPDGLQIGRGANNENLVIDWKTCNSIHPRAIQYDFVKYGYDVQAAMYCEIITAIHGGESNMMFIFQEKNEPYDVLPVLVKWDSVTFQEGANKWRNYYIQARDCFESGVWPGVASRYDQKCLIME